MQKLPDNVIKKVPYYYHNEEISNTRIVLSKYTRVIRIYTNKSILKRAMEMKMKKI